MSRRRQAIERTQLPDPVYNDLLLAKMITVMMRDGKKSIAQGIVYKTFDKIQTQVKETAVLEVFHTALANVTPKVEVKSRRVGGSTYQVPVEVREKRKSTLAIRWIIQAAKARNGQSMIDKLSAELLDAFNNRGTAVKKKEDTHKMAEANRAFAHYIW